MTAVHPLFIVDVTDDASGKSTVINRRTGCSENSAPDQRLDYEDDSEDEDLRFPDEQYADRNAILESMSSMFRVLRVFGMYFRQDDAKGGLKSLETSISSVQSNSSSFNPDGSASEKPTSSFKKRWYPSKIYSILVLILLWGNVVRFFLAFTSRDQLDSVLINKLTTFAWMLLAAINHTSCVVACWSGRLDRVLRELRITDKFALFLKQRSFLFLVLGQFFFVGNVIFVAVTVFIQNTRFDNLYAPFYTYISVSGPSVYAVKVSYFLVSIYIVAAWMLPQALNHALAMILFCQYRMLNDRFVKAIDDEGKFNGNLRTFRRRHQALCRAVKRADHFVMIGNVAGFICHMFTVIVYLFSLIIYSSNDVMTNVSFFLYLILNIGGLVLTTANGIMINEMAHRISERIHNIDLSQLTPRDNSELNMFQRRLTGQAIGFSVLGIFVINRKTVLSLLGLLITYFLLAIRMWKTFSNSGNKSCNSNTTSASIYTTVGP